MSILDDTDIRILRHLQQNGRIAVVDLAERVHLSPTACRRRLKNIEDAGIVTGYTATVSSRSLGFQVEAFVAVTIERQVKDTADTFKGAVSRLNGVRACYLLSGDTDFLLHVVAPDLDAYTRFVLNQIMMLPGARSVRTSFVLDRAVATAPLLPPKS